MLFQFPEHVKVKGRQIGTIRLFPFPKLLSLCNHLQTADTISLWLDVTLHVVHILWIFHDESLYSWNVLSTKNVFPRVLQRWIKFPVNAPFSSRTTHQWLSLSEWTATVGSRGTYQMSAQMLGLVSQNCHPWRNKCNLLFEHPLYF